MQFLLSDWCLVDGVLRVVPLSVSVCVCVCVSPSDNKEEYFAFLPFSPSVASPFQDIGEFSF